MQPALAGDLPDPFQHFAQHRRELEFFFKTTPGRLSERQRKKWLNIAERVSGKEIAVPAFLRSNRHEPLLDVAVAMGVITTEVADRYERGTDSVEERRARSDALWAAIAAVYRELDLLFGLRHAAQRTPERFEEIPVAEVARLLGVDQATVRRQIRKGELSSSRAGFVRLNYGDIQHFDAERNRKADPRAPREVKAAIRETIATGRPRLPTTEPGPNWEKALPKQLRRALAAWKRWDRERSAITPGSTEVSAAELAELAGVPLTSIRRLLGKTTTIDRAWFQSPEGQAFLRKLVLVASADEKSSTLSE